MAASSILETGEWTASVSLNSSLNVFSSGTHHKKNFKKEVPSPSSVLLRKFFAYLVVLANEKLSSS